MSEISTILGVSAKTLRRRAKDSLIYKYTLLSDSEIDGLIRAVLSEFPRSGEVMLSGHLKARCINVRRLQLRGSIHRVRGRTPLAPCIERRSYSVPGPNYLWHADGNHKLIKYRLVVHGAIDGFSRLITYLRCSDNNRASTVLDCFLDGVSEYGMPARIRTDKGGENVDIWQYMVDIRGENNHPYLAGSSVHNCRIERLWRDVRSSVVSTYLAVFNTLEGENVLDPNNETDLFCLHFIFVPRINEALKLFQKAWNSHSLSSENSWTPLQLYTAFSRDNPLFGDIDPESYGIDQYSIDCDVEETVSVPRTENPVLSHEFDFLQEAVDPLTESDSFGANLFIETLFMVNNFLHP